MDQSLRRYNLINNTNDEQNQINPNDQHLTRSRIISTKRQRYTISTQISSNDQDFISNRNISMTNGKSTRKRSAHDDQNLFTTENFHSEFEQNTNKRPRYEHSNSIELENQPPRSTITHRSLYFHHQQEQDRLLSTWNNHRTTNDVPLFLNDISSISTSFHRTNSEPNYHEQNLTEFYSPLLTEHHHSSIFNNNSLTTNEKNNKRLLSPQSNGSNPLRTTNFLIDNKQQIINRTGNISPAHSDSSSESTSTCSSDEQLHHHYYHIHQQQPWRTYRERENYEQLLDLAEKLSDPNRFNKVDIQQFFSYRYKIPPITLNLTSKQTACVICMSHFKNGQHIRVLPCQHEYHSKCIRRWFNMNSSCPICRRDNFLSSC